MTETQATDRAQILNALRSFICQRPKLEPGNYFRDWRDVDGRRAYRQDARDITRAREDALQILDWVGRTQLAPEYLTKQTGRLQWDDARKTWDYTTGQYFPVEYRRAAARVLASALWAYWRDECLCDSADKIRAAARRAFRSRRVLRYFA